jgi:ParB-like nuclease domain
MVTIVDYAIEDLEKMGNPKNPRWMPEQQMEALQASIQQFGLVEPLIVNKTTNRIVGGHQRLTAAKATGGVATLPAVIVELSEAEETALNLSLNKVRGIWDYDKLSTLLQEISAEDLGITGFTDIDVEAIVRVAPPDELDGDEQDSGIVEDFRNQTEAEVDEWMERRLKVQFGMFNRAIPLEEYEVWLTGLKAESQHGVNPLALGMVVARRLGIDVLETEVAEATATQDNSLEDLEEVEVEHEDFGDRSGEA